jgi:hypothetical protein
LPKLNGFVRVYPMESARIECANNACGIAFPRDLTECPLCHTLTHVPVVNAPMYYSKIPEHETATASVDAFQISDCVHPYVFPAILETLKAVKTVIDFSLPLYLLPDKSINSQHNRNTKPGIRMSSSLDIIQGMLEEPVEGLFRRTKVGECHIYIEVNTNATGKDGDNDRIMQLSHVLRSLGPYVEWKPKGTARFDFARLNGHVPIYAPVNGCISDVIADYLMMQAVKDFARKSAEQQPPPYE